MLTAALRRWEAAFLARRQPAASRVRLGAGNIYILPTRFGYLYLLATLAVFLLGTNYQNNLVLLLAYFMISLFFTAMNLTHRNLNGLALETVPLKAQAADTELHLELRIQGRRRHQAIELGYQGGPVRQFRIREPETVTVLAPAGARGRHSPGRLTVATRYPFGLFRAWSRPDLGQELLLYPKPSRWPRARFAAGRDDKPGRQASQGSTDWQGLAGYQPGDPLSQVAWKQLAQGRGMWTKRFADETGRGRWLRLADIPGRTLDERLSRLCWQVLDAAQEQQGFGLDLGAQQLEEGAGAAHVQRCLKALALYGRS
ncbi:DUF58 domain-containing protein [Gallaecimonas sp. GXIMD4217]|uniref:DUF58 domain-containing protein n=1 Tax=Gallaecimonas sp. GXIMD4217 TaxID=3131927 RepID=UPI00311B2E7A